MDSVHDARDTLINCNWSSPSPWRNINFDFGLRYRINHVNTRSMFSIILYYRVYVSYFRFVGGINFLPRVNRAPAFRAAF